MTARPAIDALLKSIDADENGGGLLSRETIRAASELRLALSCADKAKPEVSAAERRAALEEIKAWFARKAEAIRAVPTLEEAHQIFVDACFEVAEVTDTDGSFSAHRATQPALASDEVVPEELKGEGQNNV